MSILRQINTTATAPPGELTAEAIEAGIAQLREAWAQPGPHRHLIAAAIARGERAGRCVDCGAWIDLRAPGA